MQRRRNAGTRTSDGSDQLDVARLPPFRVRFRHEPRDDANGFLTIELGGVAALSAVRALLANTPFSRTMLVVDARRTLSGRSERLSPALAAHFAQHGLSRSLRVDRSLLAELVLNRDRRLTVAAIEGPVDHSDAMALEASLAGGTAPLEAELRADAVMQCGRGRSVWSQFREAPAARRFVGETLAVALAHMVGADTPLPRPSDSVLLGLVTACAAGCTIRPRDIHTDDGITAVPVRSLRSGRIVRSFGLDRITSRWYA